MIIYHDTSPALLTPKVNKMIDSYVDVFHKKRLRTADLPTLVGELTGYELITRGGERNGWCNGYQKVIAIGSETVHKKEMVLHEMGHAIQFELECFEKMQGLISEELTIEWQADTIAKELHKRMYPSESIHPVAYKGYFDDFGWQFLIDWYGKWRQNDIEDIMVKYNESARNRPKTPLKSQKSARNNPFEAF